MNHYLRLWLVPLLALMNAVPLASQALSPPAVQPFVQPPRTAAVEAPQLARLVEPRLSLRQGAEQPVRLGQVQIDLELTPGAALTRIEMRFDNPNTRPLEGDLEFPLAPGQTVVGFALDVDGQLRDAVPVDKPKAQAVFEAIERQRVDPGLLQMTEGNNYKLRVYPIPAQGSRTVVLRIGEALSSNAGQVSWRLPLMPRVAAGAYALHVAAHGFAQAPRVEGDLKLGFVQNGSSFVGHTSEQSLAVRPMLLRATRDDGPRVLLGEREGRRYFHLDLPVPGVDLPRPRPRRIALVWDASGSGQERDTVRERTLVAAYLRGLGDVSVKLYWLRDTLAAAGTMHVQAGDSSALDRQLAQVPYDGATALAGVAAITGVDEILLVSDGLANHDADALAVPQLPTHTIHSAPRANTRLLQRWADGSGGRYIDLTQLSADEAAQLLRTAPVRITGISSDGATEFASSRGVATDGRMDIAGVMTEAAATITIELTDALGHKRSISHRITAQDTPSSLAPALWGERRIAALEGEGHLHRAAIRRIGQQVGLVTRDTSLLVLERVEDYVRFDIEPPAPLRAAYEARLSTARREQIATRSQHLERVVKAFKARVAWWEQSFPKEPPIAVQISSTPGRAPMAAVADAQLNETFAPALSLVAPAPAPAPAAAARQSLAQANTGRADKAASAANENGPRIQLKPWTPDAPYMKRLQAASAQDLYRVYLDERGANEKSTAFFLDAADQFFAKGQRDLGLRVLSNLAEMELENRHILRLLGYRLMQAADARGAVSAFTRVLALAPEEPQSHRDLGLALAANGQAQRAIESLYEVASRPWDGRFPDIEQVAIAELNAIVANSTQALDTRQMDTRLLRNLPVDLRVVLGWDADNTDIDLWVTDPHGERAYYGRRATSQGGRMSADFTGGYGPEEFVLRKALPGKYKVEANFYGHRQQVVSGATSLMMALQTGFGTARAKEQRVTLRLREAKEGVLVGEFEVAGNDGRSAH